MVKLGNTTGKATDSGSFDPTDAGNVLGADVDIRHCRSDLDFFGKEKPTPDRVLEVVLRGGDQQDVGSLAWALEQLDSGDNLQINLRTDVDFRHFHESTWEGNGSNCLEFIGHGNRLIGGVGLIKDLEFGIVRDLEIIGAGPNADNWHWEDCDCTLTENIASFLNPDGNLENIRVGKHRVRNSIFGYGGASGPGQGNLNQFASDGESYNNLFIGNHFRPLDSDGSRLRRMRNLHYNISFRWTALQNGSHIDSIEELVLGGPTRPIPYAFIDGLGAGPNTVCIRDTFAVDAQGNSVLVQAGGNATAVACSDPTSEVCGDLPSELIARGLSGIGTTTKSSCLQGKAKADVISGMQFNETLAISPGGQKFGFNTPGGLKYDIDSGDCDSCDQFLIAFNAGAYDTSVSPWDHIHTIQALRGSDGQTLISSSDNFDVEFYDGPYPLDLTTPLWQLTGISIGDTVTPALSASTGGDLVAGGSFSEGGQLVLKKRGMLCLVFNYTDGSGNPCTIRACSRL